MRLPRDLSGEELAGLLGRLGYQAVRQTGSHMRLIWTAEGEHRITRVRWPKHTNPVVGLTRLGLLPLQTVPTLTHASRGARWPSGGVAPIDLRL